MDSGKKHRKSIPFIRIDTSSITNNQNSYISATSSEESLPVEVPLVRQPRCSVDIDTISTVISEKSFTDGNDSHSNSYLDSPDLQETIRDMA